MYLQCPLCQQPLSVTQTAAYCAQAHHFDRAKEGYFNLLPVQHKHSKSPGDTPASLQSRRQFLRAGHYAPLKTAVVQCLQVYAPQLLVDVGCGEGYYTAAMAAVAPEVTGVDIAKSAVRMAAKAYKNIQFLVASSAKMPLALHSMDAMTSIFSPVNPPEALRVLRPEGCLITVKPAQTHLQAMREMLFEQVALRSSDKLADELTVGFKRIAHEQVTVPLVLNQEALNALISMTPYAYKAKRDRLERLTQQHEFTDTAVFQLNVYQRV